LFKQGRTSEALNLVRPLVQRKDIVDPEAAALAAACLGSEGKHLEAARIDQMVCDANPSNPQGWNSLGYDLLNAGDLEGALEAYGHALELEPGRASAHYNVARIAARMGNKPKAIEHFVKAVGLQSDYLDRLDEDPDLRPLKDDPGLQERLPGQGASQDPYAEYYATES
jgi:tetratricopeptide (TPR) repeat protein